MNIFPAIDLYEGKVVRLFKGDYDKMTVYSENPSEIAQDFKDQGAKFLHIVDLEGAKSGKAENSSVIKKIIEETGLFVQVGGGIRTPQSIEKYLSSGSGRVILGTAAVENEDLLIKSVEKYGEKIAVGVDIKDGFVAIKGWREKSDYDFFGFCEKMQQIGVKTIICTDISRDGVMKGTNCDLYKKLSESFDIDIIASGGVSSIEDIKNLSDMGLYGAIIGKAYYTGAVSIKEAIEVAK